MAKTITGNPHHITDRLTLSAVAETVTLVTVPAWVRRVELFPEFNDIKIADGQQGIVDGAASIGAKYHLIQANSGYSLDLSPGRQAPPVRMFALSSPVASAAVGVACFG